MSPSCPDSCAPGRVGGDGFWAIDLGWVGWDGIAFYVDGMWEELCFYLILADSHEPESRELPTLKTRASCTAAPTSDWCSIDARNLP